MLYICKQCSINFNSNEKNRKFCSVNCYNFSKNGPGNPFFGKKHKKETIEKAKEKIREKLLGDKNPFFGKKHTEKSRETIRIKNKEYREKNKEKILLQKLKNLDLTKEKLEICFDEYKNITETFLSLEKKYNIDRRILKKYFIVLNICSKNELEYLAFKKKYKNSISNSEIKFYELLVKNLNDEFKVDKQFNIKGTPYYYDYIINNILLVEYDGYYWHEEKKSKNDEIKNEIAKKFRFSIYRVKENKKRSIDSMFEINKIKDILNEIQTEKN